LIDIGKAETFEESRGFRVLGFFSIFEEMRKFNISKLAQDFTIDLIHGFFGQSFSESGERGVIRRGFAKGQIQESFK